MAAVLSHCASVALLVLSKLLQLVVAIYSKHRYSSLYTEL